MFTEKPRVNGAVTNNGAVINVEASGPGCIQKAGFDQEDNRVTYANRAALHESLGLASTEGGGSGCIQKAGYDDDEFKVTYANRSVLHASLGISEANNAEVGGPGCIRKAGFEDEEEKIVYRNQADIHARIGVKPETDVAIKSPIKAPQKEVAPAEERPTSPNERIYGVVNTSRLNKLYDLVVIGGGPAGVAGAIKAAQMGRRAILIDKVCFSCCNC